MALHLPAAECLHGPCGVITLLSLHCLLPLSALAGPPDALQVLANKVDKTNALLVRVVEMLERHFNAEEQRAKTKEAADVRAAAAWLAKQILRGCCVVHH